MKIKLWFLIAISVLCTRINLSDGDPLRPCNVQDGKIADNEAGNCTFTEGVCQWKLLGWLSDFKGNSFSSAVLPTNSKRGIIEGTCTCPRGPQSHCLAFNYNATKDGHIDMVIKSNTHGKQKRHVQRVEYILVSTWVHTELPINVDGYGQMTIYVTFISTDTIIIRDFHYFSKPCMNMSPTTVATTTSQKQRSKMVTVSVAEAYSFNDNTYYSGVPMLVMIAIIVGIIVFIIILAAFLPCKSKSTPLRKFVLCIKEEIKSPYRGMTLPCDSPQKKDGDGRGAVQNVYI